jgi:hypothetical protein
MGLRRRDDYAWRVKRISQRRCGGVLIAGLSLLLAVRGRAETPPGPAPAMGRVSGVVEDVDGALIPGAQVLLQASGERQQMVSGSDGRFAFAAVPAGSFTVTAKEQGMVDGTCAGTVAPQQEIELDPVKLKAGASMEVDAITQQEMAEIQVKAAEKQRIGGIIPNYYVVYDANPVPLTKRLKFELGWRTVIDPVNVAFVGAVAGVQQAAGTFSGYGPGPSGYGKRFGAGMADATVGTLLTGAVLPVVFRQDPRYFYKGTGTVRERTWYALKTTVVAKGDNGKWQPAYANVLGSFGAGAVSNLYYPAGDRRGAMLTAENALMSLAFDGFSNVMQEFVLRKMTPRPKDRE